MKSLFILRRLHLLHCFCLNLIRFGDSLLWCSVLSQTPHFSCYRRTSLLSHPTADPEPSIARYNSILHPAAVRLKPHASAVTQVVKNASMERNNVDDDANNRQWNQRRVVCQRMTQSLVFGVLSSSNLILPERASASELGTKITQAITTSDLGITVRRSVVRGAQVFDRVDEKWEQFSDQFQLGTERAKQASRPIPRSISPSQPLDSILASQCLQICDQVFLQLTAVSATKLQQQIQTVSDTVSPSFERVGLSKQEMIVTNNPYPTTSAQFNFLLYVHYKAYIDLWSTQNKSSTSNFQIFRERFEAEVGQQLVSLLAKKMNDKTKGSLRLSLTDTSTDSTGIQQPLLLALETAVNEIDHICQILVDSGFVSAIDDSASSAAMKFSDDQVIDWSQGLSSLTWSIALDGDVSLSTQILLQEQGYRLYPSFARFAVQSILRSTVGKMRQKISIQDYYLDTDYNSDPEKFEVKEVLLNIEIESE
jgi:hypothetical protein